MFSLLSFEGSNFKYWKIRKCLPVATIFSYFGIVCGKWNLGRSTVNSHHIERLHESSLFLKDWEKWRKIENFSFFFALLLIIFMKFLSVSDEEKNISIVFVAVEIVVDWWYCCCGFTSHTWIVFCRLIECPNDLLFSNFSFFSDWRALTTSENWQFPGISFPLALFWI